MDINKFPGVIPYDPLMQVLNPQKTALAILECLMSNDPEGVIEVIEIYLDAINKSKMREGVDLAKSTTHSLRKHRNPTIKTLAKIMHASIS